MRASALGVDALSVVLLFTKYFATISVQAVERLRHRRFRYPEDAKAWASVVGEATDRSERAQHLLRNDAESQVWYLALGCAYVLLDAWPTGAPLYFGGYMLSRILHAYFFFTRRQPHRNRAFAIGIAILFALAGHVAYAAIGNLSFTGISTDAKPGR